MKRPTLWARATMIAAAVALSLSATYAIADKPDASKCTPQDFQGIVTAIEQASDLCWKFPVVGTLNGTYTSCLVADETGEGGISFFALGSDPDVYSAYWDEWIETSQGRIDLKSYGVGFFSSGMQVALSKAKGISGKYAGATGVFSMIVSVHGAHVVARLTGNLCSP